MRAVIFAVLIACASQTSAQQAAVADQIAKPVNTINGHVPPGILAPLDDVRVMIDTIDADGNRLVVMQGIRRAGTRVGIHVHEYGGHTCVLSGAITDFVEGQGAMRFPAGTCYYMPPDTPMTAANLGTEDAVLIDTFILPPGSPTITILEPGYPGYKE
ncbi:cupin domain-containing protein [Shimia ponticola]|uniref:cupin domain-containing protein n=1 Tax=Shimia ponticola TaxID=2582893 RepID=UPI001C9AB1CE|nr:hypothetical protein [Shimia ponticola]